MTELGAERDSVMLPGEESGQSVGVPLAAVPLEMTPPQVTMPTSPSGASGKEGDRATESPNEEVRHRGSCVFSSLFSGSFVLCRA